MHLFYDRNQIARVADPVLARYGVEFEGKAHLPGLHIPAFDGKSDIRYVNSYNARDVYASATFCFDFRPQAITHVRPNCIATETS